jgi:hypothetical protein
MRYDWSIEGPHVDDRDSFPIEMLQRTAELGKTIFQEEVWLLCALNSQK